MTAQQWLEVMQQAEDYPHHLTPLIKHYGELLLSENSLPPRGMKFVKANEAGLPKKDGCYPARYLHMGAGLDITDGKIKYLSLPHKPIPLHEINLEYLEWLDEDEGNVRHILTGEEYDNLIKTHIERMWGGLENGKHSALCRNWQSERQLQASAFIADAVSFMEMFRKTAH